jgi:hypothetical protein
VENTSRAPSTKAGETSANFNMSFNLTTWGLLIYFSKAVLLRIFVALKNPSSRPGLNPRTLGQMASMVSTRSPRAATSAFRNSLTHCMEPCPSQVYSNSFGQENTRLLWNKKVRYVVHKIRHRSLPCAR